MLADFLSVKIRIIRVQKIFAFFAQIACKEIKSLFVAVFFSLQAMRPCLIAQRSERATRKPMRASSGTLKLGTSHTLPRAAARQLEVPLNQLPPR